MSVYIKGMEMPTSCFKCYWRCKVDPENLLCRISGEYFEESFSTIEGRHKSCPLVPVPPHGRLIDADALIVELMDRGIEGIQTDDWHEIQQAVADAPTIIPAEEGDR